VGGGRLDRDDGGYHAMQTPDRPEKILSNQPLIAVSACPMTSSVRTLVNGKSSS